MSLTDDADPARDVADAGAFDLHHVGALVGEQRGRVRAGERDREVEDADALQRAGVRWSLDCS